MQEIQEKSKWARCPNCGHKLFRVFGTNPITLSVPALMFLEGMPEVDGNFLETKCHSCKEIVRISVAE